MYRVLYRGWTARQPFPLTREGPPSTELEVLALFPVNRLVPDETLFVREAGDDARSSAPSHVLAERRQVLM